ncbi:hypothetical protein CHS0354_009102 [Potamilus streckersoni]|uniref:Uncharacterized protein n=1 Tax=Potamilus streckersoni TaxID=2493646 RepID=A0AAE0WEH4_9BIVA|nr:hypothetical protein CHS0354_009102 [Potamilus streckersoni]
MNNSKYKRALLVVTIALGPVSLLFIILSLSTDYWLIFEVDRSKLSESMKKRSTENMIDGRWTHTRHQGLFRECYTDNDTIFLRLDPLKNDPVIDGNCFFVHRELPDSTVGSSEFYISRIHLLRSHIACFILSIIILFLAHMLDFCLFRYKHSEWAYVSGVCAFTSAFLITIGIACFHGTKYLEDNKIADIGPYTQYYISWDSEVQMYTYQNYGWSYVLGWVAMGLCAVNATLYVVLGFNFQREALKREKKHKLKKKGKTTRNSEHPVVNAIAVRPPNLDETYQGYIGYPAFPDYYSYPEYLYYSPPTSQPKYSYELF